MKNYLLFVLTLLFATVSADKSGELQQTLLEAYRVDERASAKILEVFTPLLEHDDVIDAFIEESKKLNIYSTPPQELSIEIGSTLSKYPPYHSILFENEHLRVSWAITKSGEQETAQLHPWKTVMVIIQPSEFYSVREDGVSYQDNWPIGVYLLEPSLDLCSCKNVGPNDYQGLIFEIK